MSNRTARILKLFFTLLMPILIITAAVRLLATDQYLAYEYNKPSFPADPFGFTIQQRFVLASTNIHYVRAHLPNDELSKQTLNGMPVYNPREVSHMADVRVVFQSVQVTGQLTFILLVLIGILLWKREEWQTLTSALQWGGLLTCGIVLFIGLTAILVYHISPFVLQTWIMVISLHRHLDSSVSRKVLV